MHHFDGVSDDWVPLDGLGEASVMGRGTVSSTGDTVSERSRPREQHEPRALCGEEVCFLE